MSALDVFTYSGQQVRTVIVDGEPWFVVADVCDFFGVTNRNRVMQDIDADDKGGTQIDTPGGRQIVATINEPGLYALLFALQPQKARGIDQVVIEARMEQVRQFRRWITHEVLPTIRKTGQFGSQVPSSLAEALELAAIEARKIEALEAKAAEDAPKVAAYDQLMDAEGFYTMEAAAKIGGIGRTTLFNRLRDAGVITLGGRLPMQRYAHWFKVTTASWVDHEGVAHLSQTTRVRPHSLVRVLGKAGVEIAEKAVSA